MRIDGSDAAVRLMTNTGSSSGAIKTERQPEEMSMLEALSVSQARAAMPDESKSNHKAMASSAQSLVQMEEMSAYDRSVLPLSDRLVLDAVDRANKAIMGPMRSFEFAVHKGTGEIMVTIRNKDTNEIIRQIPPEKMLDMVASMWQMAGLFVDEKG